MLWQYFFLYNFKNKKMLVLPVSDNNMNRVIRNSGGTLDFYFNFFFFYQTFESRSVHRTPPPPLKWPLRILLPIFTYTHGVQIEQLLYIVVSLTRTCRICFGCPEPALRQRIARGANSKSFFGFQSFGFWAREVSMCMNGEILFLRMPPLSTGVNDRAHRHEIYLN